MEKKNKKWILPVCLLGVLVIALGLVLAFCAQPGAGNEATDTQPTQVTGSDWMLAWNVDRDSYAAMGYDGASSRIKRSDGYYYFRLAIDGDQRDYKTDDPELVNKLDMLDLFALRVDEEGVILEAVDAHYYAGGVVADRMYVEAVGDTAVQLNYASNFQGLSVELEIPETAGIYNVGAQGPLCGLPGKISEYDELIAVADENGVVTHVFLLPYVVPGDVYWNVNRMYNDSLGKTTREPDLIGTYTFTLANNGKLVEVQTRNAEVANAIDRCMAPVMALKFDEEGYASEVMGAEAVTQGRHVASWHFIDTVSEGSFVTYKSLEGSDKGTAYTGVMSPFCQVVDVSNQDPENLGGFTELRHGDLVHCITDGRNQVVFVFVMTRLEDSPMYWNFDRRYDDKTKSTTRTADADGYYRITLAANGKHVTLKTKDKALMSEVEKFMAPAFGLKLDGDVILDTYHAQQVSGGMVWGSWYDVTDISKTGVVTAKRVVEGSEKGKVITCKMASDAQVVNVSSSYESHPGELATLKVGDRIHCMRDIKGELKYIFVVGRPVDVSIYWNRHVMYKNGQTTRERAADGYYYFEMAVNGKAKTLKTKDRTIANKVDSMIAHCMGLKVSGDVILDVYAAAEVRGCLGGPGASWYHVTGFTKYSVTAEKRHQGSEYGKKVTLNFASNCKIYNVSDNYVTNYGEYSSLKKEDMIHCLLDSNGNVSHLFIIETHAEGTVYWNLDWKPNKEGQTTRIPDADGWYYFDMAANGERMTLKTQDATVAAQVDAYIARCMGLKVDGDVIVRTMVPASITGYEGGVKVSWCHITELTETGAIAEKMTAGGDLGATYEIKLAENCDIFNVSTTDYKDHPGERTELKVGDMVHCLLNGEGETTMVYVIEPGAEGVSRAYCPLCQEDVYWAPWDQENHKMAAGLHYYLDSDVTVPTTVQLEGEVTLALNGHTLTAGAQAFRINAGGTLNILDNMETAEEMGGSIVAMGDSTVEGAVVVMWTNNTALNLYSGTLRHASAAEGGKDVLCGGVVAGCGTFTMYGGTVTGGHASGDGGNIRLYYGGKDGQAAFIMKGGKVENGVSGGNGGNIASSYNGRIVLEGGTVTGGKAAAEGGNVYTCSTGPLTLSDVTVTGGQGSSGIYAGSTVTLSGNVQLTDNGNKNLFIATEKALTANQLDAAAKVSVSAAVELIGTAVDGTAAALVKPDGAATLEFVEADGTLWLRQPDAHKHCVCGGEAVEGHTCDELLWTAWGDDEAEKTTLPQNTGNYYLVQNINISVPYHTWTAQDVKICLNGFNINQTGVENNWVGGSLTITDCTENPGTVSSNSAGHTSLYYVAPNSSVNLYRATLSGAQATPAGGHRAASVITLDPGADATSPATFNMYSGKLIGRDAASVGANGGAIWLMRNKSTFNMYGGTITGCTGVYGGVLDMAGDVAVEVNLYGGTITGNTATGRGGFAELYHGNKINICGDVQITGNKNSTGAEDNISVWIMSGTYGGVLNIVDATGANVGVSAFGYNASVDVKAIVATNGKDVSGITCDKPGYMLVESAGGLYQKENDGSVHYHCVCGSETVKGHTCTQILWTAWGDDEAEKTTLPQNTGNYYLVQNIDISVAYHTWTAQDVKICLNGFNINQTGVENNWVGGSLTITDCTENPGTVSSNSSGHTSLYYVAPDSSVNLYRATLSGAQATPAGGHRAASVITLDPGENATSPATFNMYSGKLIGRNAASVGANGGAIWLMRNKSTFNMYGGTITGCTGVYGGVLDMAGDVAVEVNLYGGTITGNTATGRGGFAEIYAANQINICGNVKITGNKNSTGAEDNISVWFLNGTYGGVLNIVDATGAQIGISAYGWNTDVDAKAIVATNGKDVSGITCDKADYTLENVEGSLYQKAKTTP